MMTAACCCYENMQPTKKCVSNPVLVNVKLKEQEAIFKDMLYQKLGPLSPTRYSYSGCSLPYTTKQISCLLT